MIGLGLGLTKGRLVAAGGGGGDVVAPTLSSAVINAAGTSLTLTFDEAVSVGAGGNGGWTLAPSGAAATLTYASGSGSTALVYTISRAIAYGETATTSYTQPGSGIEDAAGNDLASITNFATTNNASAYIAEVLADSPVGYYRLNEAAPSGAGTVLDSSGNANHIDPPASGITWDQRGAIGDGSGAGAEFLFTSSISASAMQSILADGTWTIEFWYYPQPSSSSSGGGYLISGASDSTHKVAIQHTSNTFFSTSNAGGNRSSFTSVSRAWNHVVLTSGGAMYVNGVAQGGTGSAATLSTAGMIIGGRQNGTEFARGRFAEVAFYGTALSEARILAHYAAGIAITLPSGRFFYWDMEQQTVNESADGVDDVAQYDQGAALSSAQAYSGTQSLSVGGGTFRAATFDHPHDSPGFCNLSEGTVRGKFRYTGTITTFMVFQITGKDRTALNESEDGMSLRFTSSNATFGYSWNNAANGVNLVVTTPLAADTWHTFEFKWRSSGTDRFSATVNGVTTTSTTAFGSWSKANASHRLIGNDLAATPTGLWIDEFEVFGSWQT